MSVYSIYFSPTGKTKKVMEILGKEFRKDEDIDLTDSTGDYSKIILTKDDFCLIAVPVFGGRVPAVALERMKRMQVSGSKAVIVAAYGNRAYDDTLLELKNELVPCGFQIISAIAAVTEHSIMHQFGTGRPDEQDVQELIRFANKIKERMNSEKEAADVKVPGNSDYREYNGVPFKPQADKKCTQCGICALQCPVGAIAKDNPKVTDDKKCISCMRCVAICPQEARNLNKAVLFVASQKMKKACSGRKKNELFL